MENRPTTPKIERPAEPVAKSQGKMLQMSDKSPKSEASDADNLQNPSVATKKLTAVGGASVGSTKMTSKTPQTELAKPFSLPSVLWCERQSILAFSARAVPYFDKDKNRISKGKVEKEGETAIGFTTKPNKGITTWDASKLCWKKDAYGSWTLVMCRTGNETGLLVIDVDVRGEQTAEEAIGSELYNKLWADCEYIVKTGSGGYHFYFWMPDDRKWLKKTNLPSLAGFNTNGQLDVLANGGSVILAGSGYTHENIFYRYKVDVVSEETNQVRTMDDIGYPPDWLITALDDALETEKPKPTPKVERPMENAIIRQTAPERGRSISPGVRTTSNDLQLVCDLINCFQRDFFASYDNWFRFIVCLKTINKSEAMKALCVASCAKSPRHGGEEHHSATAQKWDEITPNGTMGLGMLRYWARQQNEKKYLDVMKQSYTLLLLGSINDISSVFASECAGSLVYDDNSNPKEPKFYRYDEALRLWKTIGEAQLDYYLVELMPCVIGRVIADLHKLNTGESEDIKTKIAKLAGLQKSINTGMGSKYLKPLRTILNPSLTPNNYKDQKFVLNDRPELLPLANGVFNFKSGLLEPYDRSHFISYKLDINYNPDADTSNINKAFKDWYKNDTEKIAFIKYWLGYCLTGWTERDEFLIVYGSKGGNGKTLLFEEILGDDIFGDRLYQSLSEDALVKKGGHNDSLYDAEGKRLLLMSEVGKARGNNKLNVEILKKWTGRGTISANAKFEREKRFTPVGKIVMLTNQLPELPADDGGIARRLLCLEQNVMFVKPELYEEFDETMKTNGDVKPQDDGFIRALRADKEAWVKWLIEGALEYVADPKRKAPTSILEYTAECRAKADPYMSWINGNFIITGKPKDAMLSPEITSRYNEANGIAQGNAIKKKELLSRFASIPKITQEGDQAKGRLKIKGLVWAIGCYAKHSDEQRAEEEEAFEAWKAEHPTGTPIEYLATEDAKAFRE